MFSLASGYYQSYIKQGEVRLLIIGLDGSGKSAILERLRVTDFKTPSQTNTEKRVFVQRNNNSDNDDHSSVDSPAVVTRKDVSDHSRRRFACPAPLSYRRNDDDDDEIYAKRKPSDKTPSYTSGIVKLPQSTQDLSISSNSSRECYESMKIDQLEGKSMFPMRLLKPTVGMNLARFEVSGAKVKAMDLGGSDRFRVIWDRYYSDIDAIAFIVDISPTSPVPKLMEARASYRCMRDNDELEGLPILIFGNKFDEQHQMHDPNSSLGVKDDADQSQLKEHDENDHDSSAHHPKLGILNNESLTNVAGLFLFAQTVSTTSPRPELNERNYHDDDTAFFVGSAKTGEGVRSAFQWLIDTSLRVSRERNIIR